MISGGCGHIGPMDEEPAVRPAVSHGTRSPAAALCRSCCPDLRSTVAGEVSPSGFAEGADADSESLDALHETNAQIFERNAPCATSSPASTGSALKVSDHE